MLMKRQALQKMGTTVWLSAVGAIERYRQANAALRGIMLEANIPGTPVELASLDQDRWQRTISEQKMGGTACS